MVNKRVLLQVSFFVIVFIALILFWPMIFLDSTGPKTDIQTLPVSWDTYLSQSEPDTAYSDNELLHVGYSASNQAQNHSALLAFNVSTIPADLVALQIRLNLQWHSIPGTDFLVFMTPIDHFEDDVTWNSLSSSTHQRDYPALGLALITNDSVDNEFMRTSFFSILDDFLYLKVTTSIEYGGYATFYSLESESNFRPTLRVEYITLANARAAEDRVQLHEFLEKLPFALIFILMLIYSAKSREK